MFNKYQQVNKKIKKWWCENLQLAHTRVKLGDLLKAWT